MNDLKSNKINIQNKKYDFQKWKNITFQNINFFMKKIEASIM